MIHVNQEESEQNEVDRIEKGADSTGKVMHIAYVKERLVICIQEDNRWSRYRMTTDEERVIHVAIEVRLCR